MDCWDVNQLMQSFNLDALREHAHKHTVPWLFVFNKLQAAGLPEVFIFHKHIHRFLVEELRSGWRQLFFKENYQWFPYSTAYFNELNYAFMVGGQLVQAAYALVQFLKKNFTIKSKD